MTSYVHAGGLGGSSSNEYTGGKFYHGTSPVLFVNSNTGADGADRGASRRSPLATLAYAIKNVVAAPGYVVVVEAGHEERITETIEISLGATTICGEGDGNSRPSIRHSDPSNNVIYVQARGVDISGLRFVEASDYGDFTKIEVNTSDLKVSNCDFMFGDRDVEYGQSFGISINPGTGFKTYYEISKCNFAVSYTAGAATFYSPGGIVVSGDSGTFVRISDCTFSGGTSGWVSTVGSSDGPFYIADAALVMTGTAMLNGASGYISPASTGIATAIYNGIGDILW
jgi:hypothetical protein